MGYHQARRGLNLQGIVCHLQLHILPEGQASGISIWSCRACKVPDRNTCRLCGISKDQRVFIFGVCRFLELKIGQKSWAKSIDLIFCVWCELHTIGHIGIPDIFITWKNLYRLILDAIE